MKYKELKEPCKTLIEKGQCLGCVGLAEEDWHENKDCIYARVPKAKESIEQIKINLGRS